VPDGLTIFVVAKSADLPGPPVAIIRTITGRWPLPFTLDDSNAMMPGRNLSTAQHVTIEARVSRSGMATPQAGDFQSSIITIHSHDSKSNPKPVQIVIDHVIG
jgi:cytochrome c-type biogenesis protein CcmH